MSQLKDWILRLEDRETLNLEQLQKDHFGQFLTDDESSSANVVSCEIIEEVKEDTGCSVLCFKHNEVYHGFSATYRSDGIFQELSLHLRGVKRYTLVQRMEGGSYLMTCDPHDDGRTRLDVTYLYPKHERAIRGHFEVRSNGVWALLEGKYGKVQQEAVIQLGVLPMPAIQEENSPVSYRYDPSTSMRISHDPLLEDPYEQETVYVAPSTISPHAGEGLFAKRHIRTGELVSLFSGLREIKHGRAVTICATDEAWSDYRLTLDSLIDIDVPLELTTLDKYRATLGHKACHSFEPKRNAKFDNLWHPRFGRIMSIVALRDIRLGEEILVKYGYDLRIAPEWYKQLHQLLKKDCNATKS